MSDQFGGWGKDDDEIDARIKSEQDEERHQSAKASARWERWHTHVHKFTLVREERPDVFMVINIETGQVIARESTDYRSPYDDDEVHWSYSKWDQGWSRVRAETATSWARKYRLSYNGTPFNLGTLSETEHLPSFFFKPSDEKPAAIREFKRAYKQIIRREVRDERKRKAALSTEPGWFAEGLGCLINALIYGFVGGGIAGLLIFGWKQL